MATLLLVDDNAMLSRFTVRNLSTAAPMLRVLTAGTCAAARELVADRTPDVAVIDLSLPDGDGLGLARDAVALHPGLKTILITGASTPEIAADAQREGIFEVLEKPIEIERLADAIRRSLGLGPGELADGAPAADPRPAMPARSLDRHRVINRLSGMLVVVQAWCAELRAEAGDAEAIRLLIEEYEPRMVRIVREVSAEIKQTAETAS